MNPTGAVLPAPSFTAGRLSSSHSTVSVLSACRALAILLVMFWISGTALAATYAYRNIGFAYDTPSGGATSVTWHTGTAAPACTSYPNGDDDWADIGFSGGFTFTFGGTSYSGVRVYSNGILAFGNDVSGFHRDYSPQALPITAAAGAVGGGCPNAVPVNLMLPYWIDIVAGTANSTTGASIKYELLGTAPNRRFVISWDNVKLYGQAVRYNFQVVLYENTAGVNGNFEYRYTSGSSTGVNATVGVQLTTTDYTQYSYNQQFIDTTNGTAIFWYPANQLATKAAEYRFDESVWAGTAGEVKDTSGNNQNGLRLGNASNVAGGKLCRGGSFTNNTSNSTIDAVATPIVPGNEGSITFWYKSTNSWSTADTMLFDATTAANRPFFVMKRSNGTLRFVVTDSTGVSVTANSPTQSFAANTWVHVGVAWNMRVGTNQTTLRIFINGVLQNGAPTRGTTNGTMTALSTIYIGDNRTSGVTPSNGTPNGANGTIDEVYVYSDEISSPQAEADMNLTRPTCTTLDHFHIVHGGSTSCAPGQVTIEAHDANHALFSLAGTTMTTSASTGHGTWSVVSAINPVVNTAPGTATYTFANESSIVLALTNPFVESVNLNIASGSITESSGAASTCTAPDYTFGTICDADLTFGSCVSQFECLESGLAYNNLVTSPAARNALYTKRATTALSFDVVAVDIGGNRVSTYAANANTAVTVELVDGSGSTACASRAVLSPPASTVLTFAKASQPTEQGRKSVGFTVSKAYANVRCRVTDANQTPTVVGCSSDNFAIRPGAITIPVSGMATPPSATATPTLVAGTAFLVTATTLTSATDNYAGTLTLDTGKLTAQTTTQDTTIASGGTVGTLAFSSPLVANQVPLSGNATYTEVGYLYLAPGALRDDGFTAVDSATGDCVATTTGNLYLADSVDAGGKYGCSIGNQATVSFGRFRPYAFDTGVTHACGSFTYSGQPFPLTVTAKNSLGGTTTNYSGSFSRPLTYSDANGAVGAFSPTTLAAASFASGVADLTVTPSVSFSFTTKQTAPATLKLRVTESGGASSSLGSEGTTPLRSGRLRLVNYYGSELLKPRVEYRAEYWDGNRWAINAADVCTTLAATNIATGGLAVNALTALNGGIGFITFNTAAAGSYDIAVDLNASGVDTSCNAAHGGTVANKPWLQGYWSAPANCGGVPAWAQDPNARIRLGSPKAPYIYMRERY